MAKGLRGPGWQISLPAFGVVGGLYYLVMSVVLYRSSDRRDKVATRLAMAVKDVTETTAARALTPHHLGQSA